MKRLVIAIDCDDVLVPSTKQLVALYNRTFKTNVRLETAYESNNPDWQAERSIVYERLAALQSSDEYGLTQPYSEARDVVARLANHHELHLVTARQLSIEEVTLSMVNEWFPGRFTSISHVGMDGSKGEICARIGANVLIDDNKKHLVGLREWGDIRAIWFGDYPWQNKTENVSEGTIRYRTWDEVEQEIERLAN